MGERRGAMFDSDEPVALIFEAVVRLIALAAWSVFRLARFALRRPVLALWVGGLVLVDRYAGHAAVLLLLACLGAALASWRLGSPDSYRRLVRPRLNELWLSLTYPRKWRRVAHRVGLVAHDYANDRSRQYVYGLLHKVKVTPAGIVRLHVAIPVGLTLDDYARRADALAVAFGAREARVCAAGATSVWVELHRADVLASTIRPLPVEAAQELNLAAVPIGSHEDGSLWRFSLWQTHVLIAGATGAGKGSILWSLLRGLSPAINHGWVQVWAIDPKGGMELRPGARLFSRFEDGTPETMCDLLEDLVSVMDARAKRLASQGIRKHQPSSESPHLLAVIDELATLTAFAERSVVRRIEQALGLLLTKGRAVGITVLAAVQDPGKDVVGWRDLFPTRVAMRLDNPIQVDMVLGEGARDLGATADHISEQTPGVAFVRVEGTRTIRRVRASYLTDDDIAGLASSVTASPALSAPRPPKAVDPLDDVMADPVPGPTPVTDPQSNAARTNEGSAPGPGPQTAEAAEAPQPRRFSGGLTMAQDTATGSQRFSGYGENAPLDLDLSSGAVARQIAKRMLSPDFADWSEAVSRVGFCLHPIHLVGSSTTVNTGTGEVLSVYSSDHEAMGTTLTRCGNRRASVCPSCSRIYAADMFHLIRAGVSGGKGVPDRVSENPLVFATVTAPSFGHVHGKRDNGRRCRPHAKEKRCAHGRPTTCFATHEDGDSLLGQPLCWECYDYASHVVWQWWAPELWRRFTITLKRLLADRVGVKEKQLPDCATLQYAKVAEYQLRGLIHFHALIRLDGPKTDTGFAAAPDWLTADLVSDLVAEAAAAVRFTAPPVFDDDAPRVLAFGAQVDTRPVRTGHRTDDPERALSAEQVAGYLAKYSTKSATDTVDAKGLNPHLRRVEEVATEFAGLAEDAWAHAGIDVPLNDWPYGLLRKWAPSLGFRGHFATKSRRYSVTLGVLRRARRRAQALIADAQRDGRSIDLAALEAHLLADDEDETTLIVGQWRFVGVGWGNEGEVELARAAAARAREYAQHRAEQKRLRKQ